MPKNTPPQKPNAQIHAQNAAAKKPNAHQSNAAQSAQNQSQAQALEIYHAELAAVFKTGVAKELSYRTPLEKLLNALKPKFCTIIQETRAKENGAKPDFDIYKRVDKKDELSYNALVGFVECKDIDKDLDAESKQIQRYLEISPNIILTNYRRFILLSYGKVLYDLTLFDENLNQTLFTAPQNQDFFTLVKAFFDDTSTQIKSKAELVRVLSSQSFYLSLALKDAYDRGGKNSQNTQISQAPNAQNSQIQPPSAKEINFYRYLHHSFENFKNIENYDLELVDFCDTLAQSVVYGLFVSFVENDDLQLFNQSIPNIFSLLPQNFKTLNEFVYFSLPTPSLPNSALYVLDNVKKTLALLDKASMAKFLNLELENIAIYLYEDFLKEYDELRSTQKRKQGGVFYTPPAIVDMIVSALDELLQSKFDKKQGFLDKEVKVLDFATGTGSFLARVFEKIISKESQVFKNHAIKNKFLQDIYGFELSFVAYIVARLKLGQILKKEGFSDFSDADFQIYLNNTLDLRQNDGNLPLDALSIEWQKAHSVKHSENLLVILGNPPYNVKSKNKGKEILKLLNDYKMGLNETNIQPLDDDYIKFIRFAQHKLTEQAHKQGLMGFITNNSFLDGRTHRKMRESLARAFDEIYILNLHGDERDDENVFDIRVGVCISLFVRYNERENSQNSHENAENSQKTPLPRRHCEATKSPKQSTKINASVTMDCFEANASRNDENKPLAQIFYHSTKDDGILRRKDKFALLNSVAQNGLDSVKWQGLSLSEPYFWFVPKSFENAEYEDFWELAGDKALGDGKAIFENFSSGVKTQKDEVAIQFTQKEMQAVLDDFVNLSENEIAQKYGVENSAGWQISKAKAEVISTLKSPCESGERLSPPSLAEGGLGGG